MAWRGALAELAGYSMIKRDEGGKDCFGMHRLVQETVRLKLGRDHVEAFVGLVLAMIHEDCPDYDEAIKTMYRWHRQMDQHLSGLFAFTEQLWPKTDQIPESIANRLAGQINNLASFYQATNRLAEAEPQMLRALAIDKVAYGPDHPNVAIHLNNLAQLYQDTNRLMEAEPLMLRALAIDEVFYGPDHPEVARALNNLALLYHAMNRLGEAEPLMMRAFVIFEAFYSPDHCKVAQALNNLALLYHATNRLLEAEPLMLRALAIDEVFYGPDHPVVAIRLNNLAQLYISTNRLLEAEPLMKRTVEIFIDFTRRNGREHPYLRATTEYYGGLLIAMGESRERVMARFAGDGAGDDWGWRNAGRKGAAMMGRKGGHGKKGGAAMGDCPYNINIMMGGE